MKVNSLPGRDKEHKRIKDICDIFVLAWYTDLNPEHVNLTKYVPEKNLKKCLRTITDADFEKAALQIGHGKEELKRVINLICEKK